MTMYSKHEDWDETVAVIGISGRFPGAENIEIYWQNLLNGVDAIRDFTDDEIRAAGVDVEAVRNDPDYVAAGGILGNPDMFDAAFFGINPKDAALTDPQHRVFLEQCWSAIEDAGYDPATYKGHIGVFAGKAKNTYLYYNLFPSFGNTDSINDLVIVLGNETDYMATTVSYKLGLKGPSASVHTACSTSLVAIHQAKQSLLNYESDMALAGGVCILLPETKGYTYDEGNILSPDGHTRTFDEKAAGTVFSNGVGVVVLKRLSDAIDDGDNILAVLKGSAINNDGSSKVGYMAPSVDGQAEVIAMALADANVEAEDISYIETHGTATPLGDPIEIAALTQAFSASTDKKGFCALGSVKSNIGHLDAAAGVSGFIKTVLSLKNKQIPPSVNFNKVNPKFELEKTPFLINDKLKPWVSNNGLLMAGISSLGAGGTNAHAILQESPDIEPGDSGRKCQLVCLSAKNEQALEDATDNLKEFLRRHPELSLADMAYTLHVGRKSFACRRYLVCDNAEETVRILTDKNKKELPSNRHNKTGRPVVFMFPGQGSQYINMCLGLYEAESVYKEWFDECCEKLKPIIGQNLRELVFPDDKDSEQAKLRLDETEITQPALFITEYALAKLWMSWGIKPTAMIGHSIGEYVAACLAGVFSLDDALKLVANRGRLIQAQPPGDMLAISRPVDEVTPLLLDGMSVAAVNTPANCVVSAPKELMSEFNTFLEGRDIEARPLHTSHAFHSLMMEPALDPFMEVANSISFHHPQVPFISCVNGTWITDEDAVSPEYWVRHIRETVKFKLGREELAKDEQNVLLEVGPGNTLTALSRHPKFGVPKQKIMASARHVRETYDDVKYITETLGRLWLEGVSIDWKAYHAGERRLRVSLPTYPFQRKSFWIDSPAQIQGSNVHAMVSELNAQENAIPDLEMVVANTNTIPKTPVSRIDNLLNELKLTLEELSGLEPEDLDEDLTFLELGFDSLFLTQASTSFKKKFGVPLTFRQLMQETPTINDVAKYLDKELPEDKFKPEPEIVSQQTPASGVLQQGAMPVAQPLSYPQMNTALQPGQNVSGSVLEHVINQQLQIMNMQLESLRGAGAMPAAAPTAAAASVTAQELAPAPSEDKPKATEKLKTDDSTQRFGPWKQIDKSTDGGLTNRQLKYLNNLVERYTTRTRKSRDLTVENRPHYADPRTVSGFNTRWKDLVYSIATEKCSGSRMWDIDGNEYVDIQSGFGSVFFGHKPKFIVDAIKQQLDRGSQIGPQSHIAGQVARGICELTSMDRATFCNTGSEAVLAAMRISRTATGNDKIVMFDHDYHGIFDEVLVRANPSGKSMPVAPGIPRESVSNTMILEYGNPDSLDTIKANADEIAAVLIEPVQSRNPDLQPREFLKQLRQLTEETGIIFIFDEVITGFRLHPGGAQAYYDIEADLTTYGKVIGGGMPIGVVAGRRRYMDVMDGGAWNYGDDSFPEVGVTYFAGTFVRHPLAIAAASAVVKHLKDEGPQLQQGVADKTERLVDTLNQHFKENSVPVQIERCSSMCLTKFLGDFDYSSLLFFYIRDRGVFILEGGAFFLTTAHTDEDVDFIINVFKESVAEMQAADFLPGREGNPDAMKFAEEEEPFSSGNFPLTESQSEVWIQSQMSEQASCAYNESDTVSLKGQLDINALNKAVDTALNRHEACHLIFSPEGDYQQSSHIFKYDIPLTDLSQLDETSREQRVNEILKKEASTPFNLSTGPLFRFQLVKLTKDHHLFIVYGHHIVFDGWSSGVLLGEISKVYSAYATGKTYDLPVAELYSEYVYSELEQNKSEEYKSSMKYWVDKFSTIPPVLELPTDFQRPAKRNHEGNTVSLRLDAPVYASVKQVAKELNSTMFVLLLASYEVLLSRLSGQEDIVVGISVAGQALSNRNELVGHCVNLLPLRSRLHEEDTFSSLVTEVKNEMMDAYDNYHPTFGAILQNIKLPRDPSRAPLVEVIFNFSVEEEHNFHGLECHIRENPRESIHVDMFLNMMESSGSIDIDWDYNTELFEEQTVSRWVSHLATILSAVADDPELKISEIPLMSADEQQRLFAQLNANEASSN